MPRSYKICTSFIPGLGGHTITPARSSDQIATDERVDNVRVMPLPGMPRAAVERLKLWENGRKLRVRFLDGIREVQSRVEAIAKEWESVVNLTLDFVASGPADIRISFAEKGFSWSTVGTDARLVSSGRATMNYGWLEPNTSLREYQRVVRHEFGHALGMIHEHQNPAALGQIPWDKEKVYAYYAQQGWSRADVDFNIFNVYAVETTNFSAYDPQSIMQYAIPDSLTIGTYSVGWNTALSPTDIEFMGRQYPKQSPGVIDLKVGAPATQAEISVGGEVDSYRLKIAQTGTYIMKTDGPGDTVLTLHGPNDPGAVLTWDDDRGRGLNARIVRKLFPGTYWLTVRHKKPAATGVYSIQVTKRG